MSLTDGRSRTPTTTSGVSSSPRPGTGNLSFSPLQNYRQGSNQLSNLISNTARLGSSLNLSNYENEGSFFDSPALNLSFPTDSQPKSRPIPPSSRFSSNYSDKLVGSNRPGTPGNTQAYSLGQRSSSAVGPSFRSFNPAESLSLGPPSISQQSSFPSATGYPRKEQVSFPKYPESSPAALIESGNQADFDNDPAIDAFEKVKTDTLNLLQSREMKVKDAFERIKACKRSIHEISEECTSYWNSVQDRGIFLIDRFREHR